MWGIPGPRSSSTSRRRAMPCAMTPGAVSGAAAALGPVRSEAPGECAPARVRAVLLVLLGLLVVLLLVLLAVVLAVVVGVVVDGGGAAEAGGLGGDADVPGPGVQRRVQGPGRLVLAVDPVAGGIRAVSEGGVAGDDAAYGRGGEVDAVAAVGEGAVGEHFVLAVAGGRDRDAGQLDVLDLVLAHDHVLGWHCPGASRTGVGDVDAVAAGRLDLVLLDHDVVVAGADEDGRRPSGVIKVGARLDEPGPDVVGGQAEPVAVEDRREGPVVDALVVFDQHVPLLGVLVDRHVGEEDRGA